MALKTFIKISNVNNLSDARYCAGMGVNLLGFSLEDENPSYVDSVLFSEITQWVSGPQFVGECGKMKAEEIKIKSLDYHLDFLQTENIDELEPLANIGIPLILKLDVADKLPNQLLKELAYANDLVKYVVCKIEEAHFESFREQITKSSMIILDIDPLDAVLKINDPSPFLGFELKATPEEKTGFKDYGAIMDILEGLEAE